MGEACGFDGVHQRARLALCRDEVIPSSSRELGRRVDVGNGTRDGVRTMKVVEQPAIQGIFTEDCLNGLNVEHHGLSIGWGVARSPSIGFDDRLSWKVWCGSRVF